MTGFTRWINVVTEEESHEQPKEAKSAILADDVCLFLPRLPLRYLISMTYSDGFGQDNHLCFLDCCNVAERKEFRSAATGSATQEYTASERCSFRWFRVWHA